MRLKSFLKAVYPAVQALYSFRHYRLVIVSCLLVSCILGIYNYIFKDLPSPSSLSSQPIDLTTHIRDRNGRELYKIYHSQNRTLIKLSDTPLYMRQAILSIEDKDFYNHPGFSVSGTLRALWNTITTRRLEGGSTITQQLIKTSLLTPEQTIRRKLRELALSVITETLYTKDQILEMYLNRVGFGGAAYGIEEASQTYFGQSVKDLSLAQVALLAGLPASPTTYSPYGIHPEIAKSRQKDVLGRMVTDGYITWDQAEKASAENLNFRPPATDIAAPHFVMYVKDLLAQKYGTELVEKGGLDVITTLDLDTQTMAEKIVTEETAKIAYLHINNGAALVTRPGTGEILAMVGSRDYFDITNDGNVNVTLALRQPGSAIKPINYALAFSRGFSPASFIDDSPVSYNIPGQPTYTPINYDHRYHGKVPLRTALASSYNIPAVKLLSADGVQNMIDLGQKMGITSWNDPNRFGLSLTLGGGEVTMTDLSTVYGVLANQGQLVNLYPILSVRDSTGHILEQHIPIPQSVLDPGIAFLISDILSDNYARAPTFGLNSYLNIPKVAVKTGTTNDLRDNWTIGYTPDILAAVWVGNNDNSSMSYVASGVTGASPIWFRIMSSLVKTFPPPGFSPPGNVDKYQVCSSVKREDYFLKDFAPKTACSGQVISQTPRMRDKLLVGTYTLR